MSYTDKLNNEDCRSILFKRVETLFRHYGLDVADTLSAMKDNQIILSGSGALAPILSSSFTPGDLDFFGPPEGAEAFYQHILSNTNYVDVSKEKMAEAYAADCLLPYDGSIDRMEQWIVRWLEVKQKGWKLNIISTGTQHPLQAVQWFDSTVVQNFVSHAGVGSMFPTLTCRKLAVWLNSDDEGEHRSEKRKKKYVERGFWVLNDEEYCKLAEQGTVPSLEFDDDLFDYLWMPFPGYSITDCIQHVTGCVWKVSYMCKG
ncbi:hypothetical protein NMY22_g11771 [Coprinellus aureogranulatus]|nr:hypothetical protein NMY22_g11771 [Coprinellus aureogranulatus]